MLVWLLALGANIGGAVVGRCYWGVFWLCVSGVLHPAMAPYHMASSNAYQMAPINGIEQWHPTTWRPDMARVHGTRPTMAPYIGTQQWYRNMAPWHPGTAAAMAGRNGSNLAKSLIHQWRPRTAATTTSPKLSQWRPAMASITEQ